MALRYEFVWILVLVYGTSYSLKFLERYDIPILAVEILAGVIFGSLLGLVGPATPGYEFLLSLASFGLLLIMFDAGLELDLTLVREDPRTVSLLGVCTFAVPFASGVGLGLFLGLTTFASILIGVTVSTTSLGLVYPLLEDFGYIDTDRGQLLLSVAVFNDVLSVVALAYAIAFTAADPVLGAAILTLTVLAFFVVVPSFLVEYLEWIVPSSVGTNPTKFGVFLAVVLALVMEVAGVHAILGGFFAGVLIAEITNEGHEIERAMKPVVDLAAPVFFFFVGMQFRVRGVGASDLWVIATVVVLGIGAKVFGSVLGGALADVDRHTTLLLAAVMPGRLAISVAAAEIGLGRGIVSPTLYDAFLVLSTLSVFVASLAFRYLSRRADGVGTGPSAST
ncbi:MAG: cation:proton antiporter [Halanaeroarchaeum sp.]